MADRRRVKIGSMEGWKAEALERGNADALERWERGFHVVKAETLERLASGGWMFGL
jgi:hypothetical protein